MAIDGLVVEQLGGSSGSMLQTQAAEVGTEARVVEPWGEPSMLVLGKQKAEDEVNIVHKVMIKVEEVNKDEIR